jgi:hypothetical protein
VQSYDDLLELARLCWRQAKATRTAAVAEELVRMAKEYQRRAGELAGGKLPKLDD